MIRNILRVSFLLAISAIVCRAYPTGAPAGTCLSLLPRHDENPKSTPSPYRIEVSQIGNEIQVDLLGSEPFSGFLINARLASDPNRLIPGSFSTLGDPNVQRLDCLSEKGSGVTHTSASQKSAIRVQWDPPAGFDDQVIFVGAVVKTFSEFWSDIRSTGIQAKGTRAAIVKPKVPDHVYQDCGVKEGCFGLPINCIDSRNCDLLARYHEEPGAGYYFHMISTTGTNKYAAMGISHDNIMGNDAVVECLDIFGNLSMRESWNVDDGRDNEVMPSQTGIRRLSIDTVNGVQSCEWRRPYTTSIRGTTFDLRRKPYILLAIGNVSPDGQKKYHDVAIASASKVDLSGLEINKAENSHVWVQAHATLMTVAWLFTASVGMMLARHFKNVWEDKMPCGVKMWFACHRLFMILTLLFSIVGVVIMFYRFGIFTMQAGFHPIVGLLCVGLCICQPIMALFRCHPGTKKRPLFNWAHWFVGNAAQIFGVIAIFLAVDLPKAKLFEYHWFIYLIMAFVIFNVICHLVLQIHGFSVDKRVSTTPDIHLQAMGSAGSQMAPVQMIETKDSPGSDFRRFMLGIYIVGLLFIVGAMVAVVWLTETNVFT